MELRLGGLSGNLYEQAYAIESRKLQLLTEQLLEDALHESSDGPTYLDLPEVRDAVLDSWKFLDTEGNIELHAACVMSNHVHIVAAGPGDTSNINLGRLMQRHKGFTAQKCNEVLDRVGQPFWAANYFDRTVRRGSWLTVMWYVLNNPVKAGLVEWWGDWEGTYVSPQFVSHFL
jgi:REP element-mobilizing transposase RayT